MKKIFLSISLISITLSAFCQSLKPVKIDSLLTVSLPAGFQKKDTLGQQIYSGNGMYGYIVVIRAANAKNNTPLKKERDLNKVLKDYIKGIQGQSGGSSAQNVRDTVIGTLKAKVFTLRSDDGSGVIQLRNFILLYTQDVTYTFEYVFPDSRTDVVKDELKAYSSSIKLSADLQRNDQYLSNAKGMSLTVEIALIAGGILIIIVLIIFINKRKKPEQI